MGNGNGTVKSIAENWWKFIVGAALVFTGWMAYGALAAYKNTEKLETVCQRVDKITDRNNEADKDWSALRQWMKTDEKWKDDMDEKMDRLLKHRSN